MATKRQKQIVEHFIKTEAKKALREFKITIPSDSGRYGMNSVTWDKITIVRDKTQITISDGSTNIDMSINQASQLCMELKKIQN